MKPTQEQIEAALRYADGLYYKHDFITLAQYRDTYKIDANARHILSAAYREKCEECELLKNEVFQLEKRFL